MPNDQGLLNVLMQINKGVPVGGRDQGDGDPAMKFILEGLGTMNAPVKPFAGGGGVPSRSATSPLAKALGMRR